MLTKPTSGWTSEMGWGMGEPHADPQQNGSAKKKK
jgi:hypothetical protein